MPDKIRKVSVEIASELFTNGSGEHAKNLNLILEGGRYVGGWCESAVADVIERKLRAAEQSFAPDVCPVCLGKKLVQTKNRGVINCASCNGTGQRR